MGRANIRRRKPAHHLPKVQDRDLPTENDLIPPHIMWPPKGSGFEADPFSPAGGAQIGWRLTQALARRPGVRWINWLLLAFFGAGMVIAVARVVIEVFR